MTNRTLSSSAIKRVAIALSLGCAMAVAAASVPMIASATAELSPQQQSQAGALASKLLSIATSLPAGSSLGAYEGAFAEAVQGYSPEVIDAALAQVSGTPGLPLNATQAAAHLDRFYADNGHHGYGGNSSGGLGGFPAGAGEPGYGGGGGGGSNYREPR